MHLVRGHVWRVGLTLCVLSTTAAAAQSEGESSWSKPQRVLVPKDGNAKTLAAKRGCTLVRVIPGPLSKRVAFVRSCGEHTEFGVIDAGEGTLSFVSREASGESADKAFWSSDGELVAFTSIEQASKTTGYDFAAESVIFRTSDPSRVWVVPFEVRGFHGRDLRLTDFFSGKPSCLPQTWAEFVKLPERCAPAEPPAEPTNFLGSFSRARMGPTARIEALVTLDDRPVLREVKGPFEYDDQFGEVYSGEGKLPPSCIGRDGEMRLSCDPFKRK